MLVKTVALTIRYKEKKKKKRKKKGIVIFCACMEYDRQLDTFISHWIQVSLRNSSTSSSSN
jgi:hypothetical protein